MNELQLLDGLEGIESFIHDHAYYILGNQKGEVIRHNRHYRRSLNLCGISRENNMWENELEKKCPSNVRIETVYHLIRRGG